MKKYIKSIFFKKEADAKTYENLTSNTSKSQSHLGGNIIEPDAKTYENLTSNTSKSQPHLGGNIIEGDPFTFSPKVWDYIIDRFAINTVLDIGSGMGYSSHYFHKKGLICIAVDGLKENIKHAIYPTLEIDLTKEYINTNVDLVHCQEVVEHIKEEYLDNTLRSLACGRFIIMTHALPNQSGYHHVNKQPREYWEKNLKKYNYYPLLKDTNQIRKIAKEDGAIYLEQTGILFANRDKVCSNPTI